MLGMPMARIPILSALLLLLNACSSFAAIHKYDRQGFTHPDELDAYLFQGGAEGMFRSTRKAEKDNTWSPTRKELADGRSHIWFEIKIRHDSQVDKGTVQVLLFEVGDRKKIGYEQEVTDANGRRTYQRRLCCSPELVAAKGCELNTVIVNKTLGDHEFPRIISIDINNDTSTDVSETSFPYDVRITRTGMYYMWFIVCDPAMRGVTITGLTRWKNPYGYLPGMMMPLMAFYGLMALCYMAIGLVWLIQYTRFWKDILQLQNCITVVILLGMLEMATWYFDLVNFNTTGFRPMGITLWAVTYGAVRKTLSRMLLLVVSMGYGVVRPTLGGLTTKVLILGTTYFVATEALDVMQHVGTIDDLTSSARVFLVLPVAVLDAIFILWIFTSLSKTLTQVQARRQTVKLELYRKFTNSLAIAVVVSVAWIGYEMYIKMTDHFNERWQTDWVTLAFWHVLTLAMLVMICWLWAPSQNSTRYAYSEELGEDFDAEEAVALTSSSTANPASTVGKTQSKGGDSMEGPPTAAAKMGAKPAKEKKAMTEVNTNVFSLDEDEEEGKLE